LAQKLLGGTHRQTDRQTGDLISFTFLFKESRLKTIVMYGRNQRRVNILDGEVIEQATKSKHLGCKISSDGINIKLEENIEKYNKLNACVKRNFGRRIRMEVK
jgi:hypothetical protein